MKTTLTVEIEYDSRKTDPEGLACAMDRLLETALSTPDILVEYGDPRVGEFFVAKETACYKGTEDRPGRFRRRLARRIQFRPHDYGVRVDWDTEGCDLSDDGIIEIPDGRGGTHRRMWSNTPCCHRKNLRARKPKRPLRRPGWS